MSLNSARGQLRLLSRSACRFNSTVSTTASKTTDSPETSSVNVEGNQEQQHEEVTLEASTGIATSRAPTLDAYNQPLDGPLEQIAQMSERQFNEILNSVPDPTLNRDEIVSERFQKLLNLYGNKDKLKRQFTSTSSLLSRFPNLLPSDSLSPYTKAELTIRQRHHQQIMGDLGSKIVNVYQPHKLITNPPSINQLTAEKLMASGAHLGRSTELFNQNFQPFVYGKYKGLHIIDLDKTISYLKSACKVIQQVAENGGIILFLGLKVGQLRSIKEAAKNCNGYYVARKWIPGTITNALENPKPRHEVDMQDLETHRELSSDESNQTIKPDLIVILNPELAAVAIKEASQARIPTIGITDTNVDPNLVTYPIPANSSSNRTTNLITGVLGKSAQLGLNRRLQKVSEYKATLGMEPNEVFSEENLASKEN